jgi:hypothetical protein
MAHMKPTFAHLVGSSIALTAVTTWLLPCHSFSFFPRVLQLALSACHVQSIITLYLQSDIIDSDLFLLKISAPLFPPLQLHYQHNTSIHSNHDDHSKARLAPQRRRMLHTHINL